MGGRLPLTWSLMPIMPIMRHLIACLAISGCFWLATGEAAGPLPKISFNRDIRPILSENCFACHGPDGAKRQAGLRLDVRERSIEELESGATAIVPEDAAGSELLARVLAGDDDTVMPPPEAKIGRLSGEQVALLRRWIMEGAKYEPHWAFVPVTHGDFTNVSSGALTAPSDSTSQTGKTLNPIDRIVSSGLAKRGLKLEPQADLATLIRRATFDITGLPPTPAEVAAFLADSTPDAYEKLLDRLLASPRYGERMTADWMDVARYSDSYGFQVDHKRPMWPWRDWVISAFNRNLPWNDFTTWQIAGDLLPHATDEQILATAFNRLHSQECEGGSIEEEYRVYAVNDRVTTFGTAFLGLTLECCRCHDHKFDPLSQREFYQFFAFFDDIDEAGLYSFFTPATPTPTLELLDAKAVTALSQAKEASVEAATQLAHAEALARDQVAEWIAGNAEMPPPLARVTAGTLSGEIARYSFDERAADGTFTSLLDPDHPATSPTENTLVENTIDGRTGKAIQLTGDHPVQTPVGNFVRSHPFAVSLWLHAPDRADRAVVFHRSMAWTDAASRGYELLIEGGHLKWSLIHFWPGDAASVRVTEQLPFGKWVHVAVSSDGSSKASGLKVFVNGHVAATEVVRDNLTREITGGGGDHIRIGERMRDHGFKGGLVDDFRVFDRAISALEIRELAKQGTIEAAIADAEDAEMLGGFFASAFDESASTQRKSLEAARLSHDALAEQSQEIMVMQEMPQPRVAYVLERGEYNMRGESVEPNTPAVLPPFPADWPRNRLGLARWLTHPDHPLLSRVTVNRVWQSLFGLGLVQSPEDLGSQSKRPEYPEVLDWLAGNFSHAGDQGGWGWDMKRLIKTIMLSKTYRQRSIAEERVMADDPQNVWLARGPRHRLAAEMIRDGALAACGLLVEKTGGPPVNTYDIPESFKPEPAGTGESLYRRSLYTFWRRTGPAPVLESFDVPKRVVCVAKRDATNTPLHAFVLMNGPQFVEASRVLAEKLLIEFSGQADGMLERAFELLSSRQPDDEERAILLRMYAEQLAWYQTHPEDATKLVAIGGTPSNKNLSAVDQAALAGVVNALMNYDGCVVKR